MRLTRKLRLKFRARTISALVLLFVICSGAVIAQDEESTVVIGQLKYNNGLPAENVNVTLVWVDDFGIVWKKESKTMNLYEAKELGNSSYVGVYIYLINLSANNKSKKALVYSNGKNVSLDLTAGQVNEASDLVLPNPAYYMSLGENYNETLNKTPIVRGLDRYLIKLNGAGINTSNLTISNSSDSNQDVLESRLIALSRLNSQKKIDINESELIEKANLILYNEFLSSINGSKETQSSGTGYLRDNSLQSYRRNITELRERFLSYSVMKSLIFESEVYKQTKPYFRFMFFGILVMIIMFSLLNFRKNMRLADSSEENYLDGNSSIIMTRPGIIDGPAKMTLQAESSLLDAAELFMSYSSEAIPILNGEKIAGIIKKSDLLSKKKLNNFSSFEKSKISEVMSKEYPVSNQREAKKLAEDMLKQESQFLIKKEGERFNEMISVFDLLRGYEKISKRIDNPPSLNFAAEKNFINVDSEATLNELEKLLIGGKYDFAIVSSNGKLNGIIVLKDILSAIIKNSDFSKAKVSEFMTRNVLSLKPGSTINDALEMMLKHNVNQIPLLLDGKVAGVVTSLSLLKAYSDLFKD